ncbi:WhiB family transcriptional regulator [Antribacter sp. KLBMP9083]|uniref:WhiB family transcriptional regulator n=1 Tax=Antribacter soli TaxID=2910976 RepID=A0AA41QFA1_9MICO|nr:WhiB family transcriptional regulator [Antribacter soli]MCF4121745.1 WhiB family transcriptional regulator [Antribacter soli]
MNTSWMLGAACARDELRDLPWVAEPEDVTVWDRHLMAKVCAACPVLEACAVAVATTPTTAGFWAGHDRTVPDLPEQPALPGLESVGRAA